MPTLRDLHFIELVDLTGVEDQDLGTKESFNLTTVAGRFHKTSALVADNYQIAVVWVTGQGGIVTFTHAYIQTDFDVLVELTEADSTDPVILFIPAGKIAHIGGTYDNNTAFAANGVAHVPKTIGRIRAKRNVADAIGDAVVTLFLVN